jgi:serine protease Do
VRPYVGIRYVQITPSIATDNKLPVQDGLWVVHGETAADLAVIAGSPAEKAGIKDGDILLKVDGQDIKGDFSFADYVQTKKPGDTITVTLLRHGKQQTVTITLQEWKA